MGSQTCRDCHKRQYDKWENSHHYRAMDTASQASVLGDFNDAAFTLHGVTSRFYRRDGRYFVHTPGPGGQMGEFEITHTFGWYPLQQYLVPFPGGRLQCLPIAWDVPGKKWYHLYPDAPIDPADWLYWTNAAQNWNGMCAECHSTNLKKNYDIPEDRYRTTWSEINVGCEACHGPGSRHVAWAQLPDMARPRVENDDLAVKTAKLDSRALVELCAPCHSRRAILQDYTHEEPDLLDSMLPSLLTTGLYFPDGQILDEVYVYGSFTQSKMYHRDVRCSDCHDVHSIETVNKGNPLCLQCHRAEEYDTPQHHFHKKTGEPGDPILGADGTVKFAVGTGAECVACHMPGRVYMGIDYRPDHSLRIPRPDLTLEIGTPNACNRCHYDKTAEWSDGHITRWYGPGRRPHWGTIIEAGRGGAPGAVRDLARLAGDPLYPVITRATALSLLRDDLEADEARTARELAATDAEALIRRTALEISPPPDTALEAAAMAPLLYDPVKAVRIEAAVKLAGGPSRHLDADQQRRFQSVLAEYVAAMTYSGDFASNRYNLGNLYTALDRPEDAIAQYRAAIRIDNLFYPAKVNLAMLYNALGDKDAAERLLRQVTSEHPEQVEVAYSLGLLLAETGQYDSAALYLRKAAEGMPGQARVHYNLGMLLDYLQQDAPAEAALRKALELEPDQLDYLSVLAQFFLKKQRFDEAKQVAEQIMQKHPASGLGPRILEFIKERPQ